MTLSFLKNEPVHQYVLRIMLKVFKMHLSIHLWIAVSIRHFFTSTCNECLYGIPKLGKNWT